MKKLMFSYGTGENEMQLVREDDVCLVKYQGERIPFSLNPALTALTVMGTKARFKDEFPFDRLIVAAYGALRKVSPKAYASFHPNIVILNGEILGRVHNKSTGEEEHVKFEYDMETALAKSIYDESTMESAALSLLHEALWQHHMKELLASTKLTFSEVDFEIDKTKEAAENDEDEYDEDEYDDVGVDGHDCDSCGNSGICPIESRVRQAKMKKKMHECESKSKAQANVSESDIEHMASQAAADLMKAMFGIDPRNIK